MAVVAEAGCDRRSRRVRYARRSLGDPDVPIEIISGKVRSHPGLVVRNETLDPCEVTCIAGLPVTTTVRTAFDLGGTYREARRWPGWMRGEGRIGVHRRRARSCREIPRRTRGSKAASRVGARRRRRCLTEGVLAATAIDRRRLSGADDPNSSPSGQASSSCTRHGLGVVQGRRRVRRRSASQ